MILILVGVLVAVTNFEVLTVDMAHVRALIQAEHCVDALGQLGAWLLVDAACIDPGILESVFGRLLARMLDRPVARLLLGQV